MLGRPMVWVRGALLGLIVAAVACGSSGEGDTSNNSPCTAGQQTSCPCPGGAPDGVQVCNSDGRGYGACDCGGGTGGHGGTGGSSQASTGTQTSLCGNGVPDPGECSGGEFACPQDCVDAGGTGGTGGGDPCAGHVFYAGMVATSPPTWKDAAGSGSLTGLDGGNHACQALNIGADHVCDYEEVLKAEMQGELSTIAKDTTAWIHRTTDAMVNGMNSPAGPGGRCNDWTYNTNHVSDGEYVAFEAAGVPTYYLDNDTTYSAMNPKVQAGLNCGGENRAILCCYAACN